MRGGKIYTPAETERVTQKFFRNRLTPNDYRGTEDIIDLGLVHVWEKGGVQYLVKDSDLAKLKGQVPKVYVSQDKNFKALLFLVEQQQRGKREKKAECSFTLKDYACLRGYTEEEIKRGGKFLEELKRDLYTGACVRYRFKGNPQVFDSFYDLSEPEPGKRLWTVKFKSPWAESILRVLRQERGQYFTHSLKEIRDRKTTAKPYLHLFYNQLVYRRQRSRTTIPIKVGSLLEEMGVNAHVLDRPHKCFKTVKECICYVATYYPEELESVCFSAGQGHKEKRLPINNFETIRGLTYKDFQEYLETFTGVKDIREVYISFTRPAEKARQSPQQLIAKIMGWSDRQGIWAKLKKYKREDTERLLWVCYPKLGYDELERLYLEEAKADYPNACRFFFETLPNALKEQKEKAERNQIPQGQVRIETSGIDKMVEGLGKPF